VSLLQRYDDILTQAVDFMKLTPFWQAMSKAGKRRGSPETQNWPATLALRCKRAKAKAIRFLTDPNAPFHHNNGAELDLRMGKSSAKVSGCFRAVRGGRRFLLLLRTVTCTARKGRVGLSSKPDENRQIS